MKIINKFLVLTVISQLILFVSYGQDTQSGKIIGKITDASNNNVVDAYITIVFKSKEYNISSDSNGGFEFEFQEAGNLKIKINSIGYSNLEKEVSVKLGETKNIQFELKQLKIELQAVEVLGRHRKDYTSDYSFFATKVAIKNKDLPQSIGSVTKELITDRQAFHLADAVKISSGVTPASFYNQFTIRGMSQGENGQIINGMRTRQFYYSQPLTANIERVEVIKGPSSVTFSSVDSGGTINLVTKKPLLENRKEVSISGGSYNTMRGTLDFTGPLNKEKTLLYRINGAYQSSNSFRDLVTNQQVLISPSISYIPNEKTAINTELILSDLDGKLDRGQPVFGVTGDKIDLNSTSRRLNLGSADDYLKSRDIVLMMNGSHKFTKGITLNLSYLNQTWSEDLKEHVSANRYAVDIAGNTIPTVVQMRAINRKMHWYTNSINAYLNIDFNLGKTKHKLLAGYDIHHWLTDKRSGHTQSDGLIKTDNTIAEEFDLADATNYQTEVINGKTLPKSNVPYFDLTKGSSSQVRRLTHSVNDTREYPGSLISVRSAYLQEHFKLNKLGILLSVRYEWFETYENYEGVSPEAEYNEGFIPRVGITYALTNNISAYAAYLKGFHPHSHTTDNLIQELTFGGHAEEGEEHVEKGLTSDLTEVGFKSNLFDERLSISASIYQLEQNNIMFGDPLNHDVEIERDADRSRGFEIDIYGHITPNWLVYVSYSLIDTIILKDETPSLVGKQKENTSKHVGNLWTRYNFNNTSVFQDFGLGLGVTTQSSRIPVYTRDFELPGFTTMDLAVYYSPANSGLQLTLNVKNVLDEKYWIGAHNSFRLFPGIPRNFMLTAAYKF